MGGGGSWGGGGWGGGMHAEGPQKVHGMSRECPQNAERFQEPPTWKTKHTDRPQDKNLHRVPRESPQKVHGPKRGRGVGAEKRERGGGTEEGGEKIRGERRLQTIKNKSSPSRSERAKS